MTLLIHIPKTAGSSIQRSSDVRSQKHTPLRWVNWEEGTPILSATRNPYDRVVSAYYFLKIAHSKTTNFHCGARRQRYRMSHFATANDWVDYFYKNPEQYTGKANDSQPAKKALWVMQAFFHQQIDYLNEAEGEPVSDRITDILRFETLADDWQTLASKYGFGELQHANKSELRPAKPWQDEISDESIAKIGELYADDFEHLNYERLG